MGLADGDGPADIEYVASKIRDLRVFGDDQGRMNRSVVETGGAVLVISQFTLLGDVRKGRRPAFDAAARPEVAKAQYETFVARLRETGLVEAEAMHDAFGFHRLRVRITFPRDAQTGLAFVGPRSIALDLQHPPAGAGRA